MFVVGLPRVGSTLVYQSLVRGLRVAYLCNAAARFPRAPATITTLLHHTVGIHPTACFESDYGVAPGWSAPAQGREVWGNWFPEDQSYSGPETLGAIAIHALRGTVGAIEAAFGRPFVNKAQGHSVRIRPLCRAFPGAIFVRVQRDSLAVAESILCGRRECFGDDGHWFSAKPSNHRALHTLAPVEQIACQIASISADMDRDFTAVGWDRVFTVGYDEFCADPNARLAEFNAFYARRTGCRVDLRAALPAAFRASKRARVSAADARLLSEAIRTLQDRC